MNLRVSYILMLLLLLVACANESENQRGNTGRLSLRLTAHSEVLDMTTRGESMESLPDINDFMISVLNGETVLASWEKYSSYPEVAVLPVGSHVIKAALGDNQNEGFELPYYEGTQALSIIEDEMTSVELNCFLANVKITTEYTDAFKKYFSDYTPIIHTESGGDIRFSKNETRAAYVKPGNITVRVAVMKQQGTSVTLEAGTIDNAKGRQHYRLKFDVDAGAATMSVSFDDATEEIPLSINVSDDVLNMKAPAFSLKGFESDVVQEIKEGSALPSTPVSTLITALAGIKRCVLTTQSSSLLAAGWPQELNLVEGDAAIFEKLENSGLITRGLKANVDKIASLDFTEVIPNIQSVSTEEYVSFSLSVTDKLSKVNDPAIVLKLKVLPNQFAVNEPQKVTIGSKTAIIPVQLDGDMSRMKYKYNVGGNWVDISGTVISTSGILHQVQLSFPFSSGIIEEQNIQVTCGSRKQEVKIGLLPPVFELSATEGDVWATKAVLHIVGENEATTEYLKSKNVTVQYAVKGTENWITPVQAKDKDVIVMTGLPEDAVNSNTYTVKAACSDGGDIINATNVLDITTEIAAQIPNAGFEEWSEEKVWSKQGKWGLVCNTDVYAFYPYASGEMNGWWNTINRTTTQARGDYSWHYAGYPGTVPTEKTDWTASDFLNKHDGKGFEIVANSGKTAMEIATVGWGKNNWSGLGKATEYKTVGALYIGTYDLNTHTEKYGHVFAYRPSKINFYYKFYSYNGETTKAFVELKDAEGNLIGYGELRIGEDVNSYQLGEIPISYNVNKKAASITIVFLSSEAPNPETKAIQGSVNTTSGFSDSRHIGSVLTVDDIKLIY